MTKQIHYSPDEIVRERMANADNTFSFFIIEFAYLDYLEFAYLDYCMALE